MKLPSISATPSGISPARLSELGSSQNSGPPRVAHECQISSAGGEATEPSPPIAHERQI